MNKIFRIEYREEEKTIDYYEEGECYKIARRIETVEKIIKFDDGYEIFLSNDIDIFIPKENITKVYSSGKTEAPPIIGNPPTVAKGI